MNLNQTNVMRLRFPNRKVDTKKNNKVNFPIKKQFKNQTMRTKSGIKN
jgi:hypothetical protein